MGHIRALFSTRSTAWRRYWSWKRIFLPTYKVILQGGSSSLQSSIDNIKPEEPRYIVRDIRSRGCGTNEHL